MKEFLEQFNKLWQDISPMQKIIGGVLLLLTLGFTIFIVVWSTRPDYQVLYSGLSLKQSGQIVQKLSEQNVDYQLDHGGRTILVNSKDARRVKVDLAGEGLPQSDIKGYELFDESKFGVTRFEQEVNLARAKEAELTKTINELAAVNDCRVHIVLPKRRGLGVGEQSASASVFLNLNSMIDNTQVDAIRHMVAGSIEGLSPVDVVIVDSEGELLAGSKDDGENSPDKRLALQAQVENYLSKKAQKMLDMALGSGNSVVKVSAELDYRQIETQRTMYDGDNAAVLSEEKTKDATGAGESEVKVTNFEVPVTVENIVSSAGNIKNIKVAVLVNYAYETEKNDEGIVERVYTPRPGAEVDKLGSIVKNAVGYDAGRGDKFQITSVPFDDEGNQRMQKIVRDQKRNQLLKQGMHYGLWALIIMVIVFYIQKIASAIRKAYLRKKALEEKNKKKEIPKLDTDDIDFDMSNDPQYMLKKRISEFSQQNPQPAAELVRSWLLEE